MFVLYLTHGLSGDLGYQLGHLQAMKPVEVGVYYMLTLIANHDMIFSSSRIRLLSRKMSYAAPGKRVAFFGAVGIPCITLGW